MKKYCFGFVLIVLSVVAVTFVVVQLRQPSNDREWSEDQKLLPEIEFQGDEITIKNIRNFEYTSETEYVPRYYERTIHLSQIQEVWFIVEPFAKLGAAHTFVSFGLNDGTYISVSVEIRKEKGETFSALKGILREYELMYVIADEKDVVKLRANYRKDQVYLYPVITTKEKSQELFLALMHRAQDVVAQPEFYNTLDNTCTTNIVSQVNTIASKPIPMSYKILLPEFSDELAYEHGFFDTSVSLDVLRQRHSINVLSEKYTNDIEYSKRIRGK